MRRTASNLSLPLLLLLALGGCSTSHGGDDGIWARDPLTGEIREFADEGEVPEGWVECEGPSACPTEPACEGLEEGACLARTDCSPIYVGIGAYPMECDGPSPPDICDGMAFDRCVASAETCEPEACGPALGLPSVVCADGSIGGSTGRCLRTADGACGWEVRDCPTDPPPPTEVACTEAECDPAPGAPSFICEDGSVGGPVCRRDAEGVCFWDFVDCPPAPAACSAEECEPAPGAPSYLCSDGSVAGPVCVRRADGVCGWDFLACASCELLPMCDLLCPEGMRHPIDEDGCEHTCECEEV